MNSKQVFFLAALTVAGSVLPAAQAPRDWRPGAPRTFKVTADRIAADNVMRTAVLTGHVEAVSEPVHIKAESARRGSDGVMKLCDPTTVTTCTNHPGICHWSLRGEVSYLDGKYVEGRNAWLEFYELPVLWLPYFYYPLEGDCSVRVMPGYTSRWGAYLMTKYLYDIAGDPTHQDNTWWMFGNTRFDLRYENGVALGETLEWNLGDFGRGKFKIYYAWDEDAGRYDYLNNSHGGFDWAYWGGSVSRDRYMIELTHRWEPTERDVVRLKGSVVSDFQFQPDFFRTGSFGIKNEWLGYSGNEIAWEHAENAFGGGVCVGGPLNDFYAGTARLPEVYFDVLPMPVLSSPVNYESESRIGYLSRQPAEYGTSHRGSPYAYNPGAWADYSAFRLDTYHRLSVPFRTMDDILAVDPRVAYRGTWWSQSGETDLTGWGTAAKAGDAFRSIVEGGVTFAARGKAWLNDYWQHVVEPYADVLVQESWTTGGGNRRPYVFDALDASRLWEDQFAGRARNLPYSYYGVTPGIRNAFGKLNERGGLEQVLDVDVYAALQFNGADFLGGDDHHRLAEVDGPNYGCHGTYVMPGARIRWRPADDLSLLSRFEYDPDNNRLALGDLGWKHRLDRDFDYFINYSIRDFRCWDFSSTPFRRDEMADDRFNWFYSHMVTVGLTHHPVDWFAWSPYIRWDIRENEVDSVGAWFDYLTDCLGFRLLVEYENRFTMVDGYEHDEDWHVGFFVYLRAFGPDGFNVFD